MRYWEQHGMTNKNKEFRKKSFGICMKCTSGGLLGNNRFFFYVLDLMAENSWFSFTQEQGTKAQ